MNDILTYLAIQQATFDEVPFNAVDSALLAQFCMARGEGIMPNRVWGSEGALAAGAFTVSDGGGGEAVAAASDAPLVGTASGGPASDGAASDGLASDGDRSPSRAGRLAGLRRRWQRVRAAVSRDGAASGGAASDSATPAAPAAPVHFVDLLRSELFDEMFAGMHAVQMKQELFWMAASPRFRDLLIYDHGEVFDEARQVQFAATTFVRPDRFAYVGFRGTDTTLTGWREDFNMAYLAPVPAQELAARYLTAMASDRRLPRQLIVGGHSKGGNLAEYAALKADPAVQERIVHLYSHDGPGFMTGLFTARDYAPFEGRMTKLVPEDSMVGILMESLMPTTVVKATGRGFEQHTVFRWEVAEDNRGFATLPALPERTQRRAQAFSAWLASMDASEREQMVDALFDAIRAAGITDAAQLFEGGHEWALVRDGVMKASGPARTTMLNALRGLTRAFSDATVERNNARRAEQRAEQRGRK